MESTGALDTDDGRALAGEIGELLESELVRFIHRVEHDHGIELDRARAALVLLTTVVQAGVTWTAHPDSAPARIAAAFDALAARNPGWSPELAETIHGEVRAFVTATGEVEITEEPARTMAGLLRRAGASPEMWWWASGYGTDHDRCWKACAAHSERMVQVALAAGVPAPRVARALADAFILAAARAKTRRVADRNDLVALLGRLANAGVTTLHRERELVTKLTSLAFEMAAAQATWWTTTPDAAGPARNDDGLAEIAVLSFQLVELFTAAADGRPADPERYGTLAARADRTLAGRGLRLAALLGKELDPAFADATRTLARAATVVTREPG